MKDKSFFVWFEKDETMCALMDEVQHDHVLIFFCLQGLECEYWLEVDWIDQVQCKCKNLIQWSDQGTHGHLNE